MTQQDKRSFVRKYRPRTLQQVIGHDKIAQSLRGHFKTGANWSTYLLHGPSGVGKTTLARIIGQSLNCDSRTDAGDMCGTCPSCQFDTEKGHPDIIEINFAETRGIDDVREILETSDLMPRFEKRVYIFDEIQDATTPAKKAMMKPLEECPDTTAFILCTTNPEKLPAAIRGRGTGKFKLNPVEIKTTAKLVWTIANKEGTQLEKKTCIDIASASMGQPRESIQSLERILAGVQGAPDNADITELLPELLRQELALSPSGAAFEVLASIYKGKYTAGMLALRDTDCTSYFLHVMGELHGHTLDYRFSSKLHDPAQKWWYKKIDKLEIDPWPSNSAMAEIFLQIVEAQKQAGEYVVDTNMLVKGLFIKCVGISENDRILKQE